ncbi:hypothetical protein WJX72_002425 [[Myrmecia] bisecta]|uniref:Replication origin-binding protein domain-containing protein n=1 Tax=[Myrmecia] bisecta TaxID=41462 RepID=A0AAW1P0P4_9CHLO
MCLDADGGDQSQKELRAEAGVPDFIRTRLECGAVWWWTVLAPKDKPTKDPLGQWGPKQTAINWGKARGHTVFIERRIANHWGREDYHQFGSYLSLDRFKQAIGKQNLAMLEIFPAGEPVKPYLDLDQKPGVPGDIEDCKRLLKLGHLEYFGVELQDHEIDITAAHGLGEEGVWEGQAKQSNHLVINNGMHFANNGDCKLFIKAVFPKGRLDVTPEAFKKGPVDLQPYGANQSFKTIYQSKTAGSKERVNMPVTGGWEEHMVTHIAAGSVVYDMTKLVSAGKVKARAPPGKHLPRMANPERQPAAKQSGWTPDLPLADAISLAQETIRTHGCINITLDPASLGIRFIRYDERYVQPFADEWSKASHVLLRSAMKTGKTTAATQAIQTLPHKSALIITNRKTLSWSSMGTDGYLKAFPDLKHYLDTRFGFNMFQWKYVVVQLESLCRVGERFDVVVLDECESLLQQFSSSTMQRLAETWECFQRVVRGAKWCLWADAFLQDRSIAICMAILGRPESMVVIENTHQPTSRQATQVGWDRTAKDGIVKTLQALAGDRNYYASLRVRELTKDRLFYGVYPRYHETKAFNVFNREALGDIISGRVELERQLDNDAAADPLWDLRDTLDPILQQLWVYNQQEMNVSAFSHGQLVQRYLKVCGYKHTDEELSTELVAQATDLASTLSVTATPAYDDIPDIDRPEFKSIANKITRCTASEQETMMFRKHISDRYNLRRDRPAPIDIRRLFFERYLQDPDSLKDRD